MAAKARESTTLFYARCVAAMEASKITPTSLERLAQLPKGHMSALKSGRVQMPSADAIGRMADVLRVRYEWLARDRGTMREEDFAATPLDQARQLVRWANVREDAIEEAVRLHGPEAEKMDAVEWVRAIDDAARRLERAGVPRPEVAASAARKIARLTKKRSRQLKEISDLKAAVRSEPGGADDAAEPKSGSTKRNSVRRA